MREREREGARKRRGAETGPGSGASSMGTLTSGGDMTRHAGSAQLGQFSVLPCCFGFSSPITQTHTRALIHGQSHTYSHPKCHGFGESRGAWAGEGPGLMETPNSLL